MFIQDNDNTDTAIFNSHSASKLNCKEKIENILQIQKTTCICNPNGPRTVLMKDCL